MAQHYIVPSIYEDISNQSQGYFAFRFTCQECNWSVDSTPIRSSVSTATNIMDIGVGLLGGFWGRAAEAGEQMYGSKVARGTGHRAPKVLGQYSARVSSLPEMSSHGLYALLQYEIQSLHRLWLRPGYES